MHTTCWWRSITFRYFRRNSSCYMHEKHVTRTHTTHTTRVFIFEDFNTAVVAVVLGKWYSQNLTCMFSPVCGSSVGWGCVLHTHLLPDLQHKTRHDHFWRCYFETCKRTHPKAVGKKGVFGNGWKSRTKISPDIFIQWIRNEGQRKKILKRRRKKTSKKVT